MCIWICGPYAGNGAGPTERAENLRALNRAAIVIYERGHIPLIGANMALPMIEIMGTSDASHALRLPLSLALLERCDACLRLPGASEGSDREVEMFVASNRPVYFSAEDVPHPDGP